MLRKFKIALWGYGQHAKKNVMPAILQSENCELVGVCTSSKDNISTLESSYGCKVWQSPDAMLADHCVDTVYICTPTGLHFEHTMKCLKAHKNVFCEKTIAMTPVEVSGLINMAIGQGVFLCETYMYFYHSQFKAIFDIVRSGDLGELKNIVCHFSIPELSNPGYRFVKGLGASALQDVGCYPVSICLSLFDSVELLSSSLSYNQDMVDLSGSAHLKVQGASAFLHWSYNSAYKATLEILGSDGSLSVQRVFSKSESEVTTIVSKDRYGVACENRVEPENAFVSMFNFVSNCQYDEDVLAKLYDQMLKRSLLLHDIKHYHIVNNIVISESQYNAKIQTYLQAGLNISDVSSLELSGELEFGENVTIGRGVTIKGRVVLGDDVIIARDCILEDCFIGSNTEVKPFTIIESSRVSDNCRVGPYARIRPKTTLENDCHIGNFVEIKASAIGENSKINHHSFIGDAFLGDSVIIGAGSITCNYSKGETSVTRIERNAFVGSGVQMVAPVHIGESACIAAGSVVTHDVPAKALSLGRAKQVNKENWNKTEIVK